MGEGLRQFKYVKTPTIQNTLELIARLHDGQTDHSGKAYVRHPMRVAENVKHIAPQISDDVIMAALLHDTIEDCGISADDLIDQGYSQSCVDMVELLTKPPGDTRPYAQVIEDLIASDNHGAMRIKLADNMDNLHPARVIDLMQINPDKAKRLGARYHASVEKLCNALNISKNQVMSLIENAPAPKGQALELEG